MSGIYHQRPYMGGGSIPKKPRFDNRRQQQYDMRGQGGGGGGMGGNHPLPHTEDDGKRLLSFREYMIEKAEDDINELDALSRYSEYKTEFMRKQIDTFFKEHQEEEWFRNKYRPDELKKLEEANKESKARRKELFIKLIEKQNTDELTIDYHHNEALSIFLENFHLLLEGASIEELDDLEARKKYTVSSIFIPNLHPSIDKAMIEKYAQEHPGFLRVAMSEAQADKDYRRRAWVTYKQMDQDSIRKLCWEYNANKINGHEIKAIVNKEMNSRVRFTQFWFCHAEAAKADLKNAARLLTYFDGEDSPLLDDIKEHLIEETNEEEKILGIDEQEESTFEFKEDQNILKALDKVVLYLRVVHSYDYYASTEYTGEDDMPQRLGIMFARPRLPSTFGQQPREDLRLFIEAQRARMDSFLQKPTISESEQDKLGRRNVDEAIEKFISKHTTVKREGLKYVCELTKKKFMAVEFVRKHMFTRCRKNLEEVRSEVNFMNNYIADPLRPM